VLEAFDADNVNMDELCEFGAQIDGLLGELRYARLHGYLDARSPHHDELRTLLRECDERLTAIAEALGGPVA
jgi:hypothetical protein